MTDKKIAIYARAEGARAYASITAQVDSCRRFAATLGCTEPDLFIDRDRSSPARRDFDRLWNVHVEEHYDMVLVTTRDRFSRDPAEFRSMMDWLTGFGLVVRFVLKDSGFVPDPI
ncbi:recombinase family protein [Sphingomonas sp. CGMCC 1.13654]|uniref:Recombinase family protein n=1 Tax=Sphingomonas chungangi TaxID=2683589 RepID=A0A838L9C4_9SPHN|nr:recombinase family protein [Sphingomonas chungangi]MVW57703.1 hypothetical protein [Sphingomonas chungangi]